MHCRIVALVTSLPVAALKWEHFGQAAIRWLINPGWIQSLDPMSMRGPHAEFAEPCWRRRLAPSDPRAWPCPTQTRPVQKGIGYPNRRGQSPFKHIQIGTKLRLQV